ncbi:MAG: PAS domain-containing protein [Caldilineaceae bacterium]|nr:PAS domain-containing protein [Caldilineaceae bacterium]
MRDQTTESVTSSKLEALLHYEAIVNASQDAIALVDHAHRFDAVNNSFCRLLSLPRDEIVGHKLEDLRSDVIQIAALAAHVDRALSGVDTSFDLEQTGNAQDSRKLSIGCYPCRNKEGAVAQAILVLRDVTQQKQVEEVLLTYLDQQEALHQIDRAIIQAQSITEAAEATLQYLPQLVGCRRASIIINLPALADDEEDKVVEAPLAHWPQDEQRLLPEDAQVCVALAYQDEPLGLLCAEWVPAKNVSEESRSLLEQVGAQLQRALHQVLLQEKLQRYTAQLEQTVTERTQEIERRRLAAAGLSEMLTVLTSNRPLADILSSILRHAELLLGADAVAVYSPVDTESTAIGPENEIYAHSLLEPVLHPADLEPVRAVVADVVHQRERIVVSHVNPNAGAHTSAYTAHLVVPIEADGVVSGVVLFFFVDPRHLTAEGEEIAMALATQIALALNTDQLQRRAQAASALKERERLARELHDAVTQSVYSLTLFAEAGRRLASIGQIDRVQEYLQLLGDTAQHALKEMRLMLYELRPAVLEQVGLLGALRQRLEAVEQRAGMDVRLEVNEALQLPADVEEGLYRICQETLNNALKHALATEVVVRIDQHDRGVKLEIRDNGIGFDPEDPEVNSGEGFSSIRERVRQLNGQLIIDSTPEQGTVVVVTVQLLADGALANSVHGPTVDSQANPGGSV